MDEFLIVAHRGASAYAPENTKKSIELAFKQKANAIEIDIRMTRDNVAICYHDETLKKAGLDEHVEDVDYQTIKDLDIEGEPLITFDEAMSIINDKLLTLIDLRDEKSVLYALDYIEKNKLKNIVLISGRDYILRRIRELNKSIKIGFWYVRYSNPFSLAEELNINFLKPMFRFCHKSDIDKAHQIKKKILTWVVNDKETMAHFIDLGIDGIVTNDPALLYVVAKEKGII